MTPKARKDLASIRGEVSDIFLAAGIPISERQLDMLLESEIEEVVQAFIRIRTARILQVPTVHDEGEEEAED